MYQNMKSTVYAEFKLCQKHFGQSMLSLRSIHCASSTCDVLPLRCIKKEANWLGITNACTTFNQSLWVRFSGIIKEKQMDIVCKCDGFYTMMSLIGSVDNNIIRAARNSC